jgi:hypothetical protein
MILAFFMIILSPIVLGFIIFGLALWKTLKIVKVIYGLMWDDADCF